MAAADYFSVVQKAYIAFYGRPADTVGLDYWSKELDAAGGDLSKIIQDFGNSDEAKELYGDLSFADAVEALYEQIFGRPADFSGLTFYVSKLTSGEYSLVDVAMRIIDGATGTDVDIVNNRIEAAQAFTDAIDTTPELLGYQGETAADIARDWLSAVGASNASLAAALASLNQVLAEIAALGNNPGQTFTLTTGVNTFNGTAGADTFNALPFDSASQPGSTLSIGDQLDGGDGVDTLNIFTTDSHNKEFPDFASVKNIEIVNIINSGAAATLLTDASKYEGVQELWQVNKAADVTKLAATTAAGFRGVEATSAADIDVTAADTATSVTIALDGVKGAASTGGAETQNRAHLDVAGAALTTVNISGTLAQKTTTAGASAATLDLDVELAKDGQAATINSAVATILDVTNAAGSTKSITSVDASGSTGAITYTGGSTVATIKTGSGDDTVTVATATSNVTGSIVNALVETGAGKDAVTISTTGTGNTAVNTGAGNDTVTLTAKGSGALTVNLGDGDDTYKLNGSMTHAVGDSVDGGAGTNTLGMTVANAALRSQTDAFEKTISNFSKLSLESFTSESGAEVKLNNLDDINYVVLNGINVGKQEITEIEFSAIAAGQSVTVAGLTFTAWGAVTGIQLAQAFETGAVAEGVKLTKSGTLTGYTASTGTSGTDAIAKFTSVAFGDVEDLEPEFGFTGLPSALTVASKVDGGNAATERLVLASNGLASGDTLTVGGYTLTADGNDSNNIGKIYNFFSGAGKTYTGFGAPVLDESGKTITWTATSTNSSVADLNYGGTALTKTTPTVTASYQQGSSGSKETTAVTFSSMKVGQTYEIDGLTMTAKKDVSAEVAAAGFASQTDMTNFAYGGTATGNWVIGSVSGAILNFEAETVGNATDLSESFNRAGATSDPSVADVQTDDGNQDGVTISSFTSGGTLEIAGAVNSAVIVGVKDASTGTADVFNLKVTSANAAGIQNPGEIQIANVETINITTSYTGTSTITGRDSLVLSVADATAVTVAGNVGLSLTGDFSKVVSFDASGVTATGANGGVSFATDVTNKSVSLKGGAGNDVLDASSITDITKVATLISGDGDDLLIGGAGRDVLTGGAGKDIFDVATVIASTAVAFDTITDLAAGDVIRFATIANTDATPTTAATKSLGDSLNVVIDSGVAVYQDYLNSAATKGAGIISWFQFSGNTYVVQDNDGSSEDFVNGTDNVVKITGLVDLTNATFSGTDLTIV